jgi:5-methylcytosine-specific restriction endonuclease McrA
MSRKGKIDLQSTKEFKMLIEASKSIREVLTKLGYKNASGAMHKKVRERITLDNLSIDHMIGRFNVGDGRRIPLGDILIENSTYTNMSRLKIRLVNEKVLDYKCVECGNEGEWMGKPITLQLDHKNGIRDDHRLENIRFMCPNCHSQTETFGGRNCNKSG